MDNNEELKKILFVEESEYDNQVVRPLVEMVGKFAKIGKTGRVFIERTNLTMKDKIALVFIVRYLASILDDTIDGTVTNEEVSMFVGIDTKLTAARVSELVNTGFLEKKARGLHKVVSLHRSKQYLEKLDVGN